jgi:hypothetical protein
MPSAYKSVAQEGNWTAWYNDATKRLRENKQTDNDVKIAVGIIRYSKENIAGETINVSEIIFND